MRVSTILTLAMLSTCSFSSNTDAAPAPPTATEVDATPTPVENIEVTLPLDLLMPTPTAAPDAPHDASAMMPPEAMPSDVEESQAPEDAEDSEDGSAPSADENSTSDSAQDPSPAEDQDSASADDDDVSPAQDETSGEDSGADDADDASYPSHSSSAAAAAAADDDGADVAGAPMVSKSGGDAHVAGGYGGGYGGYYGGWKGGWGYGNRNGFHYKKRKHASRRRRVLIRSRVRQGSKKDAGKNYGTTYYHKGISYGGKLGAAAAQSETTACQGSCVTYGDVSGTPATGLLQKPDGLTLSPSVDETFKQTHYRDHNKKKSHRNVDRLRLLRTREKLRKKISVRQGGNGNW